MAAPDCQGGKFQRTSHLIEHFVDTKTLLSGMYRGETFSS